MATALSDKTIDLVKATVPALETHGLAITRRMYERMFQNSDIRDLFNQSHHGETGSQLKALDGGRPRVRPQHRQPPRARLAGRADRPKACRLNILPEHYHAVAEALLGAIKDVLGVTHYSAGLTDDPDWEPGCIVAPSTSMPPKNVHHRGLGKA